MEGNGQYPQLGQIFTLDQIVKYCDIVNNSIALPQKSQTGHQDLSHASFPSTGKHQALLSFR